jgi:DNA-directed RNA polymerase subunit RPC12/RpoP
MTTKVCNKCNQDLPLSSFSKSSGANYVRPECKSCNNRLSKERTELRKTYGMPENDYKCPICLRGVNELQGRGGNAGVWVVDHDHTTNTFRGHLCHSCNRAIGMFQDSIENLKRAIDYLSRA